MSIHTTPESIELNQETLACATHEKIEARSPEHLIQSFFDQYQPEKYLLTELQTNIGILRSLRNEMMLWAIQYYDLGSEDFDAVGEPHDMDRRISEDLELTASMGGNLTLAAMALLMEKIGLITEKI